MPRMATLPPRSWWTRLKAGISLMHGVHHELKKFTTTGVRPNWAPSEVVGPPVSDASCTAGVDLATFLGVGARSIPASVPVDASEPFESTRPATTPTIRAATRANAVVVARIAG